MTAPRAKHDLTTRFEEALTDGDLHAIRRCPKSDLHNHFVLGGDRAFLAERTGHCVEPLDRKHGSMAEMHAWVEANVASLFQGAEGRLLAFEATLVQARRDGVTRLEIGEDIWAITLDYGSADEFPRSLERLCRVVAPQIEWIAQLGMSRHCPINALTHWLVPFLELGVYRTLDLYGDEFAQPIESFRPHHRHDGCALVPPAGRAE